jgi:hypothetical protein
MKSFKILRWRSMEKIIWTEVLHRTKDKRNILLSIKRCRANWIGHILYMNCLLKHVIEGRIEGGIEVKGTQGRRRNQLLDGPKEKSGYFYLTVKS